MVTVSIMSQGEKTFSVSNLVGMEIYVCVCVCVFFFLNNSTFCSPLTYVLELTTHCAFPGFLVKNQSFHKDD